MRLRPQRLPGDARGSLKLLGSEHVVAWGRGPLGYVVATDRALHLTDPGHLPATITRRVPWDRITRATWVEPVLDIAVQSDISGPIEQMSIRLDESGALPVVVRERVTDSIVVQERVEADGFTARVVARRDSDSGQVRWSVVPDPGTDADDPRVRAALAAALDHLRGQLGV